MDLTTQSEVIKSIEENGATLDNTSNIIKLEKEKSKPRKNKEKTKKNQKKNRLEPLAIMLDHSISYLKNNYKY
ncbi:hypothetical protein [Arsenophonus sp. PmNCSU2021_1]|uniref:hypothetical protein n=1 Tax=Arsenophonus sp. PmNCSU2021_1 TaxID=3118989 RepID=UPI002FF029C7